MSSVVMYFSDVINRLEKKRLTVFRNAVVVIYSLAVFMCCTHAYVLKRTTPVS